MAAFLDKLRTGAKETDVEDYLNTLGLESDDVLEEHADMWVKPASLEELAGVERVSDELRKGNIVLLNIEPLYKKNTVKLRQAISELKGTVAEINGDMARLAEHRILLTPSGVKIAKK
jgi:SepF-like predicted cell division protein (DUF552 family)